jgi:hypothetical protein
MYYLPPPPIFAVFVLNLCVQTTYYAPLLPHPAGAVVALPLHFANDFAIAASISHLSLEQHP